MCGIAGMIDWGAATSADALRSIGEAMTETGRHRGPDAGAVWVEAEGGVAFGQRRLAIIDLSPGGAQPMHSADRRYVITFNGEVYNYRDIRRELSAGGAARRRDSHTEVLLEACALWGIEAAIERVVGMFAFALWDRRMKTLLLARDRLGIKPLYYAATPERVLFASQLKAFRAVPRWQPTIDEDAVVGYLRHAYLAQPRTIYRQAAKLAPGHVLTLRQGSRAPSICYWDLRSVALAGLRRNDPAPDPNEAAERLGGVLRDSIKLRMVSDVPLGAFLSGGIDSSTVVALMQAQSTRPIRTFTIGFREAEYDEAAHASEVARHFGTEHTEFRLTPTEVCAVIPDLPQIWDEPFADESQIPTLLLSRLARQHVTVALSGDGGDECFGGYTRHFMLARLAALFRLPSNLRPLAASALLKLTPHAWDEIFRIFQTPAALRPALNGANLQKLTRALGAVDEHERYNQLTTFGSRPVALDPGAADITNVPPLPDAVGRLIYRDMTGYLTGDILVKLDRATMAASLEARCPFLDDRVIEFAWRLPTAVKIRDGQGKRPLRRVLRRYLPETLFERPKQGFNVPIGEWLTGPLRGWAEELLDGARIRREGLLHSGHIQACWQQHLSGRSARSAELWAILMVQAWLDSVRNSKKMPRPMFGA